MKKKLVKSIRKPKSTSNNSIKTDKDTSGNVTLQKPPGRKRIKKHRRKPPEHAVENKAPANEQSSSLPIHVGASIPKSEGQEVPTAPTPSAIQNTLSAPETSVTPVDSLPLRPASDPSPVPATPQSKPQESGPPQQQASPAIPVKRSAPVSPTGSFGIAPAEVDGNTSEGQPQVSPAPKVVPEDAALSQPAAIPSEKETAESSSAGQKQEALHTKQAAPQAPEQVTTSATEKPLHQVAPDKPQQSQDSTDEQSSKDVVGSENSPQDTASTARSSAPAAPANKPQSPSPQQQDKIVATEHLSSERSPDTQADDLVSDIVPKAQGKHRANKKSKSYGLTVTLCLVLLLTGIGAFLLLSSHDSARSFRVQWNIPVAVTLHCVEAGDLKMVSKDDRYQRATITQAFYVSEAEVTQALWTEIMGNSPWTEHEKNECMLSQEPTIGGQHPASCVSWYDAIAFLNKLSERNGKSPSYQIASQNGTREVTLMPNADGYRLLTEAEWEYAAASQQSLTEVAWFFDNSQNGTQPSCQKERNINELCDMQGNVWEWVQDWHQPYQNKTVTDFSGPPTGQKKVSRGGGYMDRAESLDLANRQPRKPQQRQGQIGFRFAQSTSRASCP